jgi:hypothetical protein
MPFMPCRTCRALLFHNMSYRTMPCYGPLWLFSLQENVRGNMSSNQKPQHCAKRMMCQRKKWFFLKRIERGNNFDVLSTWKWFPLGLSLHGIVVPVHTSTYYRTACFLSQRCLSQRGNCFRVNSLRAEMISALTKSKGKLFPRWLSQGGNHFSTHWVCAEILPL